MRIASYPKLKEQLSFEEANSIFTSTGNIKPEIIDASQVIVKGDKIENIQVITELTKDGSKIEDWAKMTTPSFKSLSGEFQIHFYKNLKTGEISLFEMKAKF